MSNLGSLSAMKRDQEETKRGPQSWQVSNRTAYLIRRLINDQTIQELKRVKAQMLLLRTSLKQQKQGHVTCLAEIAKLYKEKVQHDPSFGERYEQILDKLDQLKQSKLTDSVGRKPKARGTPLSGQRLRAAKSSLLEQDDAISDLFQDATGHDTGSQQVTMMSDRRGNLVRAKSNAMANGS